MTESVVKEFPKKVYCKHGVYLPMKLVDRNWSFAKQGYRKVFGKLFCRDKTGKLVPATPEQTLRHQKLERDIQEYVLRALARRQLEKDKELGKAVAFVYKANPKLLAESVQHRMKTGTFLKGV